jgi:hypothetical protein
MKGVKNKSADSATGARLKQGSQNREKRKTLTKALTADELKAINRRLDQCLPMETPEWLRVEQLLMQMSEFAPRLLVYEAGMAVALYADDQARRAYLLGAADARAKAAKEGQERASGLATA